VAEDAPLAERPTEEDEAAPSHHGDSECSFAMPSSPHETDSPRREQPEEEPAGAASADGSNEHDETECAVRFTENVPDDDVAASAETHDSATVSPVHTAAMDAVASSGTADSAGGSADSGTDGNAAAVASLLAALLSGGAGVSGTSEQLSMARLADFLASPGAAAAIVHAATAAAPAERTSHQSPSPHRAGVAKQEQDATAAKKEGTNAEAQAK